MCSEDRLKSAVLKGAHPLALKSVTAITTLADDSRWCESSPEQCTYLVTWMGRGERHFPLIRNGESKSCFLPTSSFNRYSQKPNWCQALCWALCGQEGEWGEAMRNQSEMQDPVSVQEQVRPRAGTAFHTWALWDPSQKGAKHTHPMLPPPLTCPPGDNIPFLPSWVLPSGLQAFLQGNHYY